MLRPSSDSGVLERFTRDLTADARADRLDPVRCREPEISRVIDILLRHGKNNPTLVGPAGVGKTAIAEGFAQRIAAGGVPLVLREVRLLSLDHVALLAGTTYRGQYEERIRAIVAETTAAKDVILFIDELHNLVGQGTAMGAAMDAANMLKPALVRGDFRVIGATTDEEYVRWVLGDPALERRFQKLAIRELGEAETLDILRARKERLERHHNVLITDEAVEAAVRLTDLHVSDRMRPDKALDALDEACAHMQAVAVYSTRAEELIRRARDATRGKRGTASEGRGPAPAARQAPRSTSPSGDPLERFAQDGFSALEKFGADLEAMLVGAPTPVAGPRPTEPPQDVKSSGAGADHSPPTATQSELARQLMEEGIVVRGHDIARVVGLMTGQKLEW